MKKIIALSFSILCGWSPLAQDVTTTRAEYLLVGVTEDTSFNFIEMDYFTYPNSLGEVAVNQSINQVINPWLLEADGEMPLGKEMLDKALAAFGDAYYESVGEYNPAVWSLEVDFSLQIFPNTLQLSRTIWTYEGGAHGFGSYFSHSFEPRTGEQLLYEDFFTDMDAIHAIFEKKFREQEGLDAEGPLDESEFWFEDGIFKLNNNFTFSEEGMSVYFNTYEISSYAYGPIEIVVSMDELRPFLKRKI